MIDVTFQIGNHSSFGEGAWQERVEGSINFLKYPDSRTLGLVVSDTSGNFSFPVFRPIFFTKTNDLDNICKLQDTSITSTMLIYELMETKVTPVFCEIVPVDDTTSYYKCIFYYLQSTDNIDNVLTFYNPIEKITIKMKGKVATYYEDADYSINWVDF
jgi:hypothetical protein